MENGVEKNNSRNENIRVIVTIRGNPHGKHTATFKIQSKNVDEGTINRLPLCKDAIPETREFAAEFTRTISRSFSDAGINTYLANGLLVSCFFEDRSEFERILNETLSEYSIQPEITTTYQKYMAQSHRKPEPFNETWRHSRF